MSVQVSQLNFPFLDLQVVNMTITHAFVMLACEWPRWLSLTVHIEQDCQILLGTALTACSV